MLPALGFGSGGVIAGSCASNVQRPKVAAGSCFAMFQSFGATVTTVGAMVTGGVVGGVIGAVVESLSEY